MISEAAFTRLPECFQGVIRIDRQIRADKVVPITLARTRRELRRYCEIVLRRTRTGGVAA